MATVPVTGVTPDPSSYVSAANAITYITGMFGTTYDAWLAISANTQNRTLVSATRYMDRLGLIDEDGVAITYTTTIQPVIDACCELAVLISDDPDVMSAIDGSANIRSVGAGSARVEFFNPSTILGGTATKLPYVVQQLLGPYLPAAASTTSITGECGNETTDFDEADSHRKTGPY